MQINEIAHFPDKICCSCHTQCYIIASNKK